MFTNTRFLRLLSVRQRRWLFWSVGLVVAYTLIGFLVLPRVVRSVVVKQLSAHLDREVSIAQVRLNPYSMSATIRGFLIKDKDGQPFVSWEEMHANLQVRSLFTSAYVFRNIELARPYLRAQVNPDRSLNFSDLLERMAREAASQPRPEKPAPPFALRIDRLQISGARMAATDLSTRQPFSKLIGPLELTLLNFGTDPENRNPYSFEGTTEEGERFTWSGHFFLDPVRSIGEFTLDNVALVKYAPLYQDLVRFDIRDGRVDLRSSYHVEHVPGTHVARLTNATVTVRSLKVAETGGTESAMEIGHFALSGISADAFGRIAEVGSIDITRVATSPFAALGAVFGGQGEEVSFQEFAAGSAELDESNRQKLDQVAKGLFERPGLQLAIEGAVDPVKDLDALRRQKLTTQLRTAQWQSLRKSERSRLTPDQITLTPQEYAELLRASGAARVAQPGPASPSSARMSSGSQNQERPPASPVKGAAALMLPVLASRTKVPPAELEGAVLDGIQISEGDFGALAEDRARRVRDYLLQTGKVEAERVFLAQPSEGAARGKGSRVYLHLR